jgi:translation initiation factor 1
LRIFLTIRNNQTVKAACGSSGTAKDGVIEVQGDHVATVMAALAKLGHTVKRSGG